MHEEIIRYSFDGEITDANMEAHKAQLVEFLESQMREDGVVPSLDLDPGWTLHYDYERNTFKFKLSVYGVYYGEEDVWDIAGVMSGRKITKSILPARSKES